MKRDCNSAAAVGRLLGSFWQTQCDELTELVTPSSATAAALRTFEPWRVTLYYGAHYLMYG